MNKKNNSMQSLVIVSNRLPFNIKRKAGEFIFHKSAGGLATALGSFYKKYNSKWIGWPGLLNEEVTGVEKERIKTRLDRENCIPVFLRRKQFENYYYGFSNKIIWPLFHYFPSYADIREDFWKSYKEVNKKFAAKIVKNIEPDAIVWIHDYHLMLLPEMIKKKLPDTRIGFFLHIPFPSSEIFRMIPWRHEILQGLLGSDLIGFHTYGYLIHFVRSVRRLLGCKYSGQDIMHNDRLIRVDSFPIGIDYGKFHNATSRKNVKKAIKKIKRQVGDRKIIVSIDRLDYTKGINTRLIAFDRFLKKYPQFHGKVSLIMVVVPSREGVEDYQHQKRILDELVGNINGKYAEIGWVPVQYLYQFQNFNNLAALYNLADVCLVTPIRDGMNLVAKEFIASKKNKSGVLILSELAGAVKEFGEALIINPTNIEQIADKIKQALSMPEKENRSRIRKMQERIKKHDIKNWAGDFLQKIEHVNYLKSEFSTIKFDEQNKKQFLSAYRNSKRRLILLDYDGTLVKFHKNPDAVKPDNKMLNKLSKIARKKGNELVIVSGRDKNQLQKWLGNLNIGLIAEHGVWLKQPNKKWFKMLRFFVKWKEKILPVLQQFVERTPGSLIENKTYSLAWHYRNVEPELAKKQANELKDTLLHITENSKIGVLDGNKVIEIKNLNINKGQAVLYWLAKDNYDFMMSIGDDETDEDVFAALPKNAFSFKVGKGLSRARFRLPSVKYVHSILNQLLK